MTLQDAIYHVLHARGRPMNIREIAHEIAFRELYEERDGTPAPPKQVSTQIESYPDIFVKMGRCVALKRWRRAA